MTRICSKNYGPSPVNRAEVLRYAGVREEIPELKNVLDECLAEFDGELSAKVCWGIFDIARNGSKVDFGFAKTVSENLSGNLAECSRAVVFAATIGLSVDRLLLRYGTISPVKALFFQAIGAERIEDLCDRFESEMLETLRLGDCYLRPRFSPGYGDFSLEFQKDIFRALDAPRRIGLTLNESLLMTPTKSVTAVIGICEK